MGLATLLVMFQFPDIYQATAVLTPAVDEKRPNPALGVLASFGVDIGSPSKVEDLETLFQSNDLTARVFRKYNLWPIVLPGRVRSRDGEDEGLLDGPPVRSREGTEGARRLGRHPGREGSPAGFHQQEGRHGFRLLRIPVCARVRRIVKYYLDEGKNRLQEEALDRAVKNNLSVSRRNKKPRAE